MISNTMLKYIIKDALIRDHLEILEHMNKHNITSITVQDLLYLFDDTDRLTEDIWLQNLPKCATRPMERDNNTVYVDTDSIKIKEGK